MYKLMCTRLIQHLNSKPTRSVYLAVFRVYLSFHIIRSTLFKWQINNILYGSETFLGAATSAYQDPLLGFLRLHHVFLSNIYLVLAVLMAFGIGKNLTVLTVFIITDIVQRMNPYVLDGGDNILLFALLYLSLANSFQILSLVKKRPRVHSELSMDYFLTNIATYCLLGHLCLAYFVSGFSKAHSEAWYNGVALYYILQIDRFTGTSLNHIIVRNGYLVTIGTYTTLLWELSFPFLIWLKPLRWMILLLGLVLHFSIFVFMMITDFQVLFIAFYGFFFTDDELVNAWHTARKWTYGISRSFFAMFYDRPIAN